MSEIFTQVAAALASGERAALVTIVRVNGSTPQRVGAKMLVFEDGRTAGTIGGGCYENDAVLKARAALAAAAGPHVIKYDLNDDVAAENGLICGGQMEVFIEPILPAPRLYVFGAGHVGYHVARLGALVGFRVHVLDDREKFADAARFPDAEVIVDHLPDWLERHPLPTRAYAVIVTRGHRHDLDALRHLVRQDLAYLGLIGSRAKIARLYEVLLDEGVEPGQLRRVHAPIGLDVGAVTPEEIAVAIAAQLVAVKYGKLQPDVSAPGVGDVVRSARWVPSSLAAEPLRPERQDPAPLPREGGTSADRVSAQREASARPSPEREASAERAATRS